MARAIGFFLGVGCQSLWCAAQVVPDASLGSQVSAGPHFRITGGTQIGPNQFHSLQRLDVPANGSATFTGPPSTRHVLARVTGGAASRINGTLACDIAGANLFLMNPSGVVFGAGANLDVSGAFTAITASFIELQDGTRLLAVPGPSDAMLTTSPPSAFGFFGDSPAAIHVEPGTTIVAQAGQTLHLAAGDIHVEGTSEQPARLGAPSGTVRLDATHAERLQLDAPGSMSAQTTTGSVTIQGAATVDASGQAGRIVIRSGKLEVTDGAAIRASSLGAQPGVGGQIQVQANEVLVRQNATIAGNSLGGLDAADISVTAGTMTLASGARIESTAGAGATGSAGAVTIDVRDVSVEDSDIVASSGGSGNAGRISFTSDAIRLNDGRIRVVNLAGSSGQGGTIEVRANQLNIINGGVLIATTVGSGMGGTIRIDAGEFVVDGSGTRRVTGINARSNAAATGPAGTIDVQADAIRLVAGGRFTATTDSLAAGGEIRVRAGSLVLDGQDALGDAQFTTGIAARVSNDSTGQGGSISVFANLLRVLNGSAISVATDGAGNAGQLQITAGRVVVSRGNARSLTGISAATSANSSGNGGQLTLKAQNVTVRDGGQIGSETKGSGRAGDVIIRLSGDGVLQLDTGGSIDSSTLGAGDAGRVFVQAGAIRLNEQARITSASSGDGNAGSVVLLARRDIRAHSGSRIAVRSVTSRGGSIFLRARRITIDSQATVTAVADQQNGGNIVMDAREGIELRNARVDAAAANNGGNISLLSNGQILIFASSLVGTAGGDGGRIQLGASAPPSRQAPASLLSLASPAVIASLLDPTSPSSAIVIDGQSSIQGRAGRGVPDVEVRAISNAFVLSPQAIIETSNVFFEFVDLSGRLAPLKSAALIGDARLAEDCRAWLIEQGSTMIQRGRGGAPAGLSDWLPVMIDAGAGQ